MQAVDHYVPAVAQLRSLVKFLPSWRLDDVMVSYAVDGGSVGPTTTTMTYSCSGARANAAGNWASFAMPTPRCCRTTNYASCVISTSTTESMYSAPAIFSTCLPASPIGAWHKVNARHSR